MNQHTAPRTRLPVIEPLEERYLLSTFSQTVGPSPANAREQCAIARRVRQVLQRSRELQDTIGIPDQAGPPEKTDRQPSHGPQLPRLDPRAVDLAFASY